jgi:hypothetical protein
VNFLRDLFGLQTVFVETDELPQSKTIRFEGQGGVTLAGEFDPDTQEITVRVSGEGGGGSPVAEIGLRFTVGGSEIVSFQDLTSSGGWSGPGDVGANRIDVTFNGEPPSGVALGGAWLADEDGNVTVRFVTSSSFEGGDVDVLIRASASEL